MSITAVAWLPLPPLIVPEIGGEAGSDDELLSAVDHALDLVLGACGADQVLVMAPTTEAVIVEGPVTWSWHGFGLGSKPDAATLPWQLGIGAWLLDRHNWIGSTLFCGVSGSETLPSSRHDTALIVLGEGSAKRSEKAPGHFDADAAAWDEGLVGKLSTGDPRAIESMDHDQGARLMSTASVTWPVAARLLNVQATSWQSDVTLSSAPFGVGYIVATWVPLS